MTESDKQLAKLYRALHKELWNAPIGKRKCSGNHGCKKILATDHFEANAKTCIDCCKQRQHSYYLKRYAIKLAANGGKPGKAGRPRKIVVD